MEVSQFYLSRESAETIIDLLRRYRAITQAALTGAALGTLPSRPEVDVSHTTMLDDEHHSREAIEELRAEIGDPGSELDRDDEIADKLAKGE